MGMTYTLFVKPLVVTALVLGVYAGVSFLPEVWPDYAAAEDAILRDDPARLEQLLRRGLDPNDRSRWRSSPRALLNRTSTSVVGVGPLRPAPEPLLAVAARRCRTRMATMLVAAGADPGARDLAGATALWHAAGCGDAALVAALLARGADAAARAPDGGNALWERAGPGWRRRALDPAVVPLLESAGARRPD